MRNKQLGSGSKYYVFESTTRHIFPVINRRNLRGALFLEQINKSKCIYIKKEKVDVITSCFIHLYQRPLLLPRGPNSNQN